MSYSQSTFLVFSEDQNKDNISSTKVIPFDKIHPERVVFPLHYHQDRGLAEPLPCEQRKIKTGLSMILSWLSRPYEKIFRSPISSKGKP